MQVTQVFFKCFPDVGFRHLTLIIVLITVRAAQIAAMGDVPLQNVQRHQSAPPPPQDEQEEQEEQDEPDESEDEGRASDLLLKYRLFK